MLVVSDTSPVSNLAIIRRLDLLHEQFGAVTIPPRDGGEAEALALALECTADLVLLDESAARFAAQRLRLRCIGVLGILRHAKVTARIPSLRSEVASLRLQARFFIAPALEKQLLHSVGEG